MQFYAYLWLREDGTPYYAGKGFGDRAFVARGHKVRPPPDRSRIIIYLTLSEAEAFALEMTLIAWYGRKDLGTGCLRNFTNGGEGQAGRIASAQERRNLSLSHQGYSPSLETRAKIASIMRGNRHTKGKHWTLSAETKKKMSESMRGVPHPKMRGRKFSPERRIQHAAAIKAWHKKVGHHVTS
jgi:hypothetical protein